MVEVVVAIWTYWAQRSWSVRSATVPTTWGVAGRRCSSAAIVFAASASLRSWTWVSRLQTPWCARSAAMSPDCPGRPWAACRMTATWWRRSPSRAGIRGTSTSTRRRPQSCSSAPGAWAPWWVAACLWRPLPPPPPPPLLPPPHTHPSGAPLTLWSLPSWSLRRCRHPPKICTASHADLTHRAGATAHPVWTPWRPSRRGGRCGTARPSCARPRPGRWCGCWGCCTSARCPWGSTCSSCRGQRSVCCWWAWFPPASSWSWSTGSASVSAMSCGTACHRNGTRWMGNGLLWICLTMDL